MPEEEFGDLLQRGVRRSLIKSGLNKPSLKRFVTKNPFGVRERVRNKESQADIPKLVGKLQENLLLVNPENTEVYEQLSQRIQEKFPHINGLSAVIVGSNVHGGAELRKIVGTHKDADIDWAITYDPEQDTSLDDVNKITKYGERIIPTLGRGKNKSLKSCNKGNPSRWHYENLLDIDSTLEILRAIPIDYDRLIIYFYPSYPVEINENNLNILLNSLNSLATQSQDEWSNATGWILSKWSDVHRIKSKHFGSEIDEYRTGIDIRRDIERSSKEGMAEPMRKLLNSTNPNLNSQS